VLEIGFEPASVLHHHHSKAKLFSVWLFFSKIINFYEHLRALPLDYFAPEFAAFLTFLTPNMDISPTALVNASTQMQQSQVAQTAQVLVLKKAMDIQASGSLALLQALPLATSGNLGTQVNTMA